jgi:protein involved in polysaccharide export with SLBB domain
MIDDVVAAGRTPENLDAELTARYAKEISSASLTVIVRSLASQRVFVGGQVAHPGAVTVNGRLNLLEAILMAGGPQRYSASLSHVVVIRNVGDKRYSAIVNLKPAMDGKMSAPFYLAANDIVLVPQSGISSLNQWVEQYINNMMPATYIRVQSRHGDTLYGYGR